MPPPIPKIFLKPREESRILEGHLWVFSNEIGHADSTPPKGGLVDIVSFRKQFLGRGFYHPNSLIAARILTHREEEINADFFSKRIEQACRLRKSLYPQESAYRLVFGESDFLPGVVIDRYGETVVVQSNCLGMDLLLDAIFAALNDYHFAKCVIQKNDSSSRSLEGLGNEVKVVHGHFDPVIPIEQGFNGKRVHFFVDPLNGQKSGFFFDQRENRERMSAYAQGKSVLDCFSYTGGFGLYAALSGAAEVTAVDSSKEACELWKKNFAVNGAQGSILCGDVFDALEALGKENRKFDIIVLDPPALAKSKKNLFASIRKYRKLNELALSLLKEEGILLSSSCSHHLSKSDFVQMIKEAGARKAKEIKLLEMRGASRDHPVLAAMPETDYLKCAISAVYSHV